MSILGAIGLCIVPLREGLPMSHAGSTVSCGRLLQSLKGSPSLIEYFGWLRSVSDKEKAKQKNCADSVAKNGKPRGKLVLALTLIMPDSPFADFARAKTLLGEYLRDADEKMLEDRGLAVLMLALLDEIARLEEQLDQLKAIEKDITETEQSVNVPTPAAEPAPVPNDELEKENTGGR
jgi:hypothetical protein